MEHRSSLRRKKLIINPESLQNKITKRTTERSINCSTPSGTRTHSLEIRSLARYHCATEPVVSWEGKLGYRVVLTWSFSMVENATI
jgi:hypothetical protein